MVEGSDKLVAEIFTGIVRLEVDFLVLTRLREVGIVQTQATKRLIFAKYHCAIEGKAGRNAIVVELEVVCMEFVFGIIHHPVQHIGAVVVLCCHVECHASCGAEGGTQTECAVFLRLQTDVALLRRTLVVEFGEGGEAERLVPRSINLPVCRRAISHVDTWIEAEVFAKSIVALSENA